MMNNKKGVILLFLLLLIMPLAYAFELTSIETSGSICPGSTILFTSNVFGLGDFTVNLDGTASSWATAVPQGFSINNQNKIIYIYTTPPSYISPGPYNLNLIVSNGLETKIINYNINVNDCHDLVLTGDLSKAICACNLDTYAFNLLNAGNYQETYSLNVQGAAQNWITLSQNSVTLSPNEQKTIYVYADLLCDIKSGNYGFTLTATNTYQTESIDSNVQVNNCFDFEIVTNKDYISMCDHSVETIELNINNKGLNTNKFFISVDGPLFANLENNELIIDGLQSKTTSLIFSPDYHVEGNFNINLEVEGDYGDIQKQKNIVVNARKCNSVLLEILENQDKICNSLSKTYQAKIKNTGEVPKEFKLETSEAWATLDAYLVDLQPSEELDFNIEISPPPDLFGNNNIYVKASVLDSNLVSSEDYININVVSSENCYKPYIQADNLELSQDSSATLPVMIKNTGSQPANYIIAISGTASSFIQLNPAVVNLEPGESEIVYLYVAPSDQTKKGIYKATISVILDEVILESETIIIKVEESTNQITGQVIDRTSSVNIFTKIKNWIYSLLVPSSTVEITPTTEIEQELQEITSELEEEPVDTLEDINISEDLGEAVTTTEPVTKGLIIDRTINAFNNYKMYLLYILIAIVVLIFLVVIYKFISKTLEEEAELKKDFEEPEEEFDEETEETEEEPLKLGRWIFGIIVLAVLVYLGYRFNWLTSIKNFFIGVFGNTSNYVSVGLSYLSIYKYYILIGLVLLLILILVMKYWKNIIDFFEEEDFEEEKPKRKKKKKKK